MSSFQENSIMWFEVKIAAAAIFAVAAVAAQASTFRGGMSSDRLYELCSGDDIVRCEAYIAGVIDGISHERRFGEDEFCFPTSWTVSDGRRVYVARFSRNQRENPGAWSGRDGALIVWSAFSIEYPCRSRR